MAGVTAETDWKGRRLGLPATGPGSVPTMGRRLAALLLDAALSFLVAGLFTAPDPPELWSTLALAVQYVVFVPLFGQTVGMRLVGLRLIALGRPRVGIVAAVVRLVLLQLLIPAVVYDRDNRGLHDRAAGTIVVRS